MAYALSATTFVLIHYLFILALACLSYLLGRLLTRGLAYTSAWEEGTVCISLGLVVLASVVLAFGLLGWLRPLPVAVGLGGLATLTYPVWQASLPRWAAAWRRLDWGRGLLLAGGVLLALPALLLPLYPPVAFDATLYHLPYARAFVEQGRLVLLPTLRFPVAPQAVEGLFTLGMLFYDDLAAQLVHWLTTALVAGALVAWGRRLDSPRLGLWAAALWLANPIVLWIGASAYIDVGLTLFFTLALYGAWRWWETRDGRWATLAGVFAGSAAATKYTGLAVIGLVGLIVLVGALRGHRWTALVGFAALTLVVAAPWYVRIWRETGNPGFPFLPTLFGANA